MHTGYREGSGGLVHPSIGSIVSAELGRAEAPLPNFVSVGGGAAFGSGFLGVRHQPLVVDDPAKGGAGPRLTRGLGPLQQPDRLARRYGARLARTSRSGVGRDHNTTYQRTLTLMRSKEAQAFDLSRESDTVRASYGETDFGRGCSMARRLVETGVPSRRGLLAGLGHP